MRKELLLAVALLLIGIIVGFGAGYTASPGKVFTTTVLRTETVTSIVTTTVVPERKIVIASGTVPLTIVYGAGGVEASAPGSVFMVRLSEDGRTLYIEMMPFGAKGSVVVKARLLDASGRVLAEGTALLTAHRELKTAIELGWYTEPDPTKIATIEITIETK